MLVTPDATFAGTPLSPKLTPDLRIVALINALKEALDPSQLTANEDAIDSAAAVLTHLDPVLPFLRVAIDQAAERLNGGGIQDTAPLTVEGLRQTREAIALDMGSLSAKIDQINGLREAELVRHSLVVTAPEMVAAKRDLDFVFECVRAFGGDILQRGRDLDRRIAEADATIAAALEIITKGPVVHHGSATVDTAKQLLRRYAALEGQYPELKAEQGSE